MRRLKERKKINQILNTPPLVFTEKNSLHFSLRFSFNGHPEVGRPCSATHLGDDGLLEHGPVVGESPARDDVAGSQVAATAPVGGGDVPRDAVHVGVVAPERRAGRQEYDGQLVPSDREFEQGQRERYPKLPPTEFAQRLLHRVGGGGGDRSIAVAVLGSRRTLLFRCRRVAARRRHCARENAAPFMRGFRRSRDGPAVPGT